jgi:hypothetical protein
MSTTIAEAIARIPVLPGHPFRARVNGQEIEVRVVDDETVSDQTPASEIWLDVPASSAARLMTVKRGPSQLPAPIPIVDTDLAPT